MEKKIIFLTSPASHGQLNFYRSMETQILDKTQNFILTEIKKLKIYIGIIP